MDEIIELAIEFPAGIIDCRLEPQRKEAVLFYNVTILYPNVVDGFSKSEIYCHNIRRDPKTGAYYFETGEEPVHPKIKKLETQISNAITDTQQGTSISLR